MSGIFGVAELQAALDGMLVKAAAANRRIVTRGQAVVNAEARKEFTGAHPRGTPTTAPPGHAPDVVTGALRRSITSSSVRSTAVAASGTVYPAVVYARIHELGGVAGRGSHLPARPYMRPALDAVSRQMVQIAAEEWRTVNAV